VRLAYIQKMYKLCILVMEEPQSTLSLSERAYVIVKSLRGASRWLLRLVIGILFFNSLALIAYIAIENLVLISIIISTTAISAYVFGWFVIKAPHTYRKLQEWDEDYLESAYILIFDTTIPKVRWARNILKVYHSSCQINACAQ
jgi:hypothetical protein